MVVASSLRSRNCRRRRLRHDAQAEVARERRAQLFREAVGEVVLARVAAQVHERQHGDAVAGSGTRARRGALPPGQPSGRARNRRAGAGEQQAAPRHGNRADSRRRAASCRATGRAARGADGPGDARDFRSGGIALPAGQVDGLVLAEAERGLGAVERYGYELALVAALRRLVAHPVGADGSARPRDDHGVGTIERRLDRLRESRTALDQRIPPDVESAGLERLGEPARPAPGRGARN